MKLLIVLLFLSMANLSCRKKDIKAAMPIIDTSTLLTSPNWKFAAYWYDSNNNGIIDSSTEFFTDTVFQIFQFQTDGVLYDSSQGIRHNGFWFFKSAVNRDTLYQAIDSNYLFLCSIVNITDSTLVLDAISYIPTELWYYEK